MDAPPLRLPDVLTDGAIRLDTYTVDDAEAHAHGEDREMRLRFDSPDPDVPASLDHVRSVMRRWIAARASGGPNIVYAIRETAGALVGGCEVRRLDEASRNLSYWTYPLFRGRGVAGRAVTLICQAVASTGAACIEAHIDADNLASRRTAEAAGFREAGEVVDQGRDGQGVTRLRYVKPLGV